MSWPAHVACVYLKCLLVPSSALQYRGAQREQAITHLIKTDTFFISPSSLVSSSVAGMDADKAQTDNRINVLDQLTAQEIVKEYYR